MISVHHDVSKSSLPPKLLSDRICSTMITLITILLFAIIGAPLNIHAQTTDQSISDRVNQGAVGIMCGRTTGSYLYFCEDLAVVLNDNVGYTIRVLPIIGEGGFRNVEDILYLKGVDLTLTNADTLDFMESQGLHPDIKKKVQYITAMAGLELHILAGNDITSVNDLAGKKVNFSSPGTGTFLTMTNIFQDLSINVEVQSEAEIVALEQLQRGEIAAMGFNAAPPWKFAASLTGNEGLHLVPVPVERLSGPYQLATWDSATYPNLIRPGETVNSSRVPVVMLAYNWPTDHPRCGKVNRFATAFRSNFEKLLVEPFQPRWKDVDINEPVKGLERWDKNC